VVDVGARANKGAEEEEAAAAVVVVAVAVAALFRAASERSGSASCAAAYRNSDSHKAGPVASLLVRCGAVRSLSGLGASASLPRGRTRGFKTRTRCCRAVPARILLSGASETNPGVPAKCCVGFQTSTKLIFPLRYMWLPPACGDYRTENSRNGFYFCLASRQPCRRSLE